jgi:hypothetical protein
MILCTGASLYAPYSLRLISNKFWLGGGGGLGGWYWGVSGGEARGPSWRGRIRGVEVEGREGVSLNRPIVGGGGGYKRVVNLT